MIDGLLCVQYSVYYHTKNEYRTVYKEATKTFNGSFRELSFNLFNPVCGWRIKGTKRKSRAVITYTAEDFYQKQKRFKNKKAKGAQKRRIIFDRDGNACLKCGSTECLTLDHVNPISKGGDSSIDNLQTLCYDCNNKKGDKNIDYRKNKPMKNDLLQTFIFWSESTGNLQPVKATNMDKALEIVKEKHLLITDWELVTPKSKQN